MLIEALQKAKAAMEAAVAKIREDAKQFAPKLFAGVFDAHPALQSFSWTQYTPYFNDGESCTFGVGDIDQVNGHEEYSDEWDAEVSNGWGEKQVKGPLYEGYRAAQTLLSSLPEDALEALFGDHVRVTVTRDAVEIEDYNHD